MSTDKEQLYQQRLKRYTTALRNGKPDMVPIRPFVAEFIATYTGYTCQDVTQDFELAFEATRKCCAGFDWDATVANMVYVWGGIPQVMNLRYYQIPGVGLSPNTGFQYLEPPEEQSFMRADEYDALIEDPTGFLFNVWLPRVSRDVAAPGQPNTYRNNVAFLKGGMSMMSYFGAFPRQIQLMREETGTVSAIAGILKAPLDILADKLRGYMGLVMDLVEQPKKVLKACEALAPHLCHVASTSSDPSNTVPIGLWLHRGCVPFVSQDHFDNIFWPTLKPIIQELWRQGKQTMFYAEGKWGAHLKAFAELPEGSIIYHIDRDDPLEVHKALHHKFALSGGVPNYMLGYGTPEEVRQYCKKLIQTIGRDGGYIMDASAIMQNDARVENVRAMTDATREYGVY
jgi:uroporphyrinogen-III decarboxylase